MVLGADEVDIIKINQAQKALFATGEIK